MDMLESHRVFAPFLDVVQAYGSKTEENYHDWSGCRGSSPEEVGNPSSCHIYGMY